MYIHIVTYIYTNGGVCIGVSGGLVAGVHPFATCRLAPFSAVGVVSAITTATMDPMLSLPIPRRGSTRKYTVCYNANPLRTAAAVVQNGCQYLSLTIGIAQRQFSNAIAVRLTLFACISACVCCPPRQNRMYDFVVTLAYNFE